MLDGLEHIAGRWKNLIALIGALFAIIGIIASIFLPHGYFSKPREETQKLLEEIKKSQKEIIQETIKRISAESFANDPKGTKQDIENIRKNPQTTLLGKAIADAISLQRQRKFKGATEKWRGIAKISEGSDNNLAARAWFSIGYLLGQQGKHEEAIEAYTEALRLKSNYYEVYTNRGGAKAAQRRYKDAIRDYDEALRLKPEDVIAYYNRGNANRELKQYAAAIADYDEAIRLKPDDADAYHNRGLAKYKLDRHEVAIAGLRRSAPPGTRLG